MSNPVSAVGHAIEHATIDVAKGVKVAAVDVAKAAVWLPEHIGQAIAVVEDVIKDSPAVRAEVKTLIAKVTALDALIMTDIAAKGMNLPGDLAALESVKDLLSFIRGEFWKTMAAAYKDLEADVK